MKIAVVIPARYESSRLPGKPLVEICGVSLLRRTHHQCIQALPAEQVHVATDDQRIADHCDEHGMACILTSAESLTGTDRVAEAARKLDADLIVNVQGDEPVIDPQDIRDVIEAAREHPGEIINGMTEIEDEALFRSSTIPKVVARPDGLLLFMSRAPIPTNKEHAFKRAWRQVCVYAFPVSLLAAFTEAKQKTALEEIEDIEILRFLELGIPVRMISLSGASVAVDVPEDVARAEEAVRRRGLEFLE